MKNLILFIEQSSYMLFWHTTFHWKVTFDLTLTYKRFVRTPKKSLFMYLYFLYISIYTLFIMYYAPGYVRLDHANKNLIIGKKKHINWTVFKIDESHERLNMFSWQISYRIAKGSIIKTGVGIRICYRAHILELYIDKDILYLYDKIALYD